MSKYKIVYIHHDGIITGSIISLLNLINKLDRELYEPILILGSEGPSRNLFEPLGIRIYIIPMKGIMTQPPPAPFEYDYIYNWKALLHSPKRELEGLLREIKPDIVHLNDKSVIIAGRIAHRMGIKTVWHVRTSFTGKKSLLQYLITRNIILNNSDHIIAISEDETDGFEIFQHLSVIYNSIDFDLADQAVNNRNLFREEFDIKDDEVAVGMFGNLNSQKGAWNFIKAAGIAIKERGDIKFRFFVIAPIPGELNFGRLGKLGLIDTTHPFDRAKKLVEENGLSNNLIFTDRRKDVLNVMAGLDIVSACYNMNAIGRPGFEAASVGKPVIVNKGHTSKSKVVLNEITGLVIKRERPAELANAILKLAKNKDLRQLMGSKGREHVKNNFNGEKNILKIQHIYMQLINHLNKSNS
jgi:glycosyltransferase involved in cell wall biosynthesis